MVKKDKIHYNTRKIDSYDKPFNYIISPRIAGKTTAVWNKIYKRFKTKGQPSIVLRRRINDITEAYIQDIGTTINKFLPDNKQIKLEFKKGDIKEGIINVTIEGKIFIRVIALSNPKSRLKSMVLRNVAFIVFDEFICDTMQGEKYLDDEVGKFKEIYTTYSRECDDSVLKCYFMGNPYSVYNPYFADINVDYSKVLPGCLLTGLVWALECYKLKPELIEWIKKHNPLALLEDDYAKYAFGGINVNDVNFSIMQKQPNNYVLKYVFRIQNRYLGVFKCNKDRNINGFDFGKYWIKVIDSVGADRTIYAVDFNNLIKGSELLTPDTRYILHCLKYSIAKNETTYQSIECAYLIQAIYSII